MPNDPEVLRSFASLRFAQGHHAKAIDILERARALHPHSAALEYSLGKVFLELGRAPEAEPRFRACLAISPDFADAVANLGATLSLLGRDAEAVGTLRRAAELLPRSVGPLANLGTILPHHLATDTHGSITSTLFTSFLLSYSYLWRDAILVACDFLLTPHSIR